MTKEDWINFILGVMVGISIGMILWAHPVGAYSNIATFTGTNQGDWSGFSQDRIGWSFSVSRSYYLTSITAGTGFNYLTLRDGLDGNILATSSADIGGRYDFIGGVSLHTGNTYIIQPATFSVFGTQRYSGTSDNPNFNVGQLYFYNGFWQSNCPPFPFPSCGNWAGTSVQSFQGIEQNSVSIDAVNSDTSTMPSFGTNYIDFTISYNIVDNESNYIWLFAQNIDGLYPDKYLITPVASLPSGQIITDFIYLPTGNWRAYAFTGTNNRATSDFSTVKNFIVNVINTTSTPIGNSQVFYKNNLPPMFWFNATSTPSSTIVYTSMTSFFDAILSPFNFVSNTLNNYFATTTAQDYASSTKAGIIKTRQYASLVNEFIPSAVVAMLLFFFIITVSVIAFKGLWYLVKIIK